MTSESLKPGRFSNATSLPRSYQTVKARIVDARVRCADLAADAGISKATLSHIISGRRPGEKHRRAIWSAFRSRSGLDVTFKEFWRAADAGAIGEEQR